MDSRASRRLGGKQASQKASLHRKANLLYSVLKRNFHPPILRAAPPSSAAPTASSTARKNATPSSPRLLPPAAGGMGARHEPQDGLGQSSAPAASQPSTTDMSLITPTALIAG